MSSIHARSALAIMVLLAGCATTTPEERRAADERECTSYGSARAATPLRSAC